MHDISLVIFDCDGVLIDSEYLSATVLIEVFADIGVKIDLEFVYNNFVGHSFPNVAALHAKKHGSNVPETFEADYRNTLLNRFVGRLLPIAGIETVLAQLAVPYCLASGSSPARVQRSLEIVGLQNYFINRIFTTTMVKRGKPSPDIFLFAARTMGVDPKNCLVIEDTTTGIAAAKAAGMPTWHFTGGSHFKFGYEKVKQPYSVERQFDRMSEFFDAAHQLRHKQELAHHHGP